jgi:RNA polymerase sigma-70 factor (ECF subfamily)
LCPGKSEPILYDSWTPITLEVGQRCWPGVTLDPATLIGHLQRAGASSEPPAFGADLYLAAACAAGDPTALAHFEGSFLGALERHLSRFALASFQVDEIRQSLRIRLLCGPQPAISGYAGRSPLDAWVRVAAIRLAVDLLRGERARIVRADRQVMEALLRESRERHPGIPIEQLRQAFQAALDESVRQLAGRERTLLRLHLHDGVGIDGIAAIYGVHRATAARWLVAMRGEIFESVRRKLSLQARPTSSEFRSLARLVLPDLRVGLSAAPIESNGT